MKIAIQAADLDASRVDGTRVYIYNLLKIFGKIAPQDEFFIYHKAVFNPHFAPSQFPNYIVKKEKGGFFWTQLSFTRALWRDRPDVLWMPMSNAPWFVGKKMQTVVTVHDLAFKYFPAYFPKRDLCKLNFSLDMATRKAKKIITVSEATKKDLLKFYPRLAEDKIRVIHHGFDGELFGRKFSVAQKEAIFSKYALPRKENYLLYVGAIQPRKGLKTLIEAFNLLKEKNSDLKLYIVGERAWFFEKTFQSAEASPFKNDIFFLGSVSFSDLPVIYQAARVFVFPSLYEGFGLPILESFASGTPVVTAQNSSLSEVGGEAAVYFQTENVSDLAEKIEKLLNDEKACSEKVAEGFLRIKNFSWEKCARETLNFFRE